MRISQVKFLCTGALALAFLAACGGGGGGAAPTPNPTTTPIVTPPVTPPPVTAGDVTISGNITFEEVGVETNNFTLDLADLTTLPARGIVVEAVSNTGEVLDTALTTDQGGYSVTVPADTDVQILARAQLVESLTGISRWTVTVEDNTNDDAEYVLAGSLSTSGSANSTRDLFAPSGSDGISAYTGARTAGPFFMLDEILDGLRLVETADPNLVFPEFRVLWSVNNRLINDDEDPSIPDGDLTSTFFSTNIGGTPSLVVLGDIMTDTDEYDEHVVTHELAHYLTFVITRDDSIGGSHSLASLLDPRVSFSEGFGNAFSAMVTGDPLYVDANFGNADGFAFSVELNTIGQIIESNSGIPAAGWYGESSVQSVIYDIFDSANDGTDDISLGFVPIFTTLQSADYLENDAASTLFSYLDAMLTSVALTPAQEQSIQALLEFQDIDGTGSFGVGETNDGGVPISLPVFPTYTVGEPAITICSIDDIGINNMLGNRTLISLDVPQAGAFTITMARIEGMPVNDADTARDPDFFIFNEGAFITSGLSPDADVETQVRVLPAGLLIVDAHDFNNISEIEGVEPGDACYAFSVQ